MSVDTVPFHIWRDYEQGMVGFQRDGAERLLVSPEKARMKAKQVDAMALLLDKNGYPADVPKLRDQAQTIREYADELEEMERYI